MDRIHIVEDGLVHGLDPVGNKHLAGKKLGVKGVCQLLNLLDEGNRLLLCNELGGLDAVHHELQFGKFKVPGADIVGC